MACCFGLTLPAHSRVRSALLRGGTVEIAISDKEAQTR